MLPLEIPKSFTIFGQTIKVKMSANLHKRENAAGQYLEHIGTIELQKNTKAYPVTQEQLAQTFMHEVIHVCLDHLKYDKLSEDEEFVDLLAQTLHQVLSSAEYKNKDKQPKIKI